MPIRWDRLQAREGPELYDPVDPVPLEAAGPVVKRISVRQELAGYMRDLRSATFVDDDTEVIREQLHDFLEEDEDERVLSDYQIELLARELGSEAEEVANRNPPRPPPSAVEPAASAESPEGEALMGETPSGGGTVPTT